MNKNIESVTVLQNTNKNGLNIIDYGYCAPADKEN